ncbi:unnamed protein product, partial [Prunus brigantina]
MPYSTVWSDTPSRDLNMTAYYVAARNLSSTVKEITIKYILATIEMAQIPSGIQIQENQSKGTIKVQRKFLSSIISRGMNLEIKTIEVQAGDWRKPLIDYLSNLSPRVNRKVKYQTPYFVLFNNELFRRSTKGVLLRRWAMYFVGKIAPSSSHEHTFNIIAIDYFTKWVEARALKTISLATVTFLEEYNIIFVQSSPYFPRENSQAEFTNKVLINIIKTMEEKIPRDWHERLSKALWVDRTSKKKDIGITPFALTYGRDAVLLVEINVQSLRLERLPKIDEAVF